MTTHPKRSFRNVHTATEMIRPDPRGPSPDEAQLPDVAWVSWRLAAPWEMPFIAEAKLAARREAATIFNGV